MDTNSAKLLAKEEVFEIVGCAIEVLNTLGHGLVEKPYENALAIELVCETFLSASNLRLIFSTKNIRSISSSPT
jgi:GxxExxY protein